MGGYVLVVVVLFLAQISFNGAKGTTLEQKRSHNDLPPLSKQQQQQQRREVRNALPMKYLSGRDLKRKRAVLRSCWFLNKDCYLQNNKKQNNNKSNSFRPSNFWITGKRSLDNQSEGERGFDNSLEGKNGVDGKEGETQASHQDIKALVIKLAMKIILKMNEIN